MHYLNPRRPNYRLNCFRRLPALAIAALICAPPLIDEASAQALYWDGNGNATGAGAAPSGGWDSSLYWTSAANGELATGAWSPGSIAIFSAGIDALGPFTVTLDAPQSASELRFEE